MYADEPMTIKLMNMMPNASDQFISEFFQGRVADMTNV